MLASARDVLTMLSTVARIRSMPRVVTTATSAARDHLEIKDTQVHGVSIGCRPAFGAERPVDVVNFLRRRTEGRRLSSRLSAGGINAQRSQQPPRHKVEEGLPGGQLGSKNSTILKRMSDFCNRFNQVHPRFNPDSLRRRPLHQP